MAKRDYFRITDENWESLKDALGTRKWSELAPEHRAVVKALVKSGFAEEASVDLDTSEVDISDDLIALEKAGMKAVSITMPEIIMRSLSPAMLKGFEQDGIAVRIQKTATTWRISSERA